MHNRARDFIDDYLNSAEADLLDTVKSGFFHIIKGFFAILAIDKIDYFPFNVKLIVHHDKCITDSCMVCLVIWKTNFDYT